MVELIQEWRDGATINSRLRSPEFIKQNLVDDNHRIKLPYVVGTKANSKEAWIDCDAALVTIRFSEGYSIEYDEIADAIDDLAWIANRLPDFSEAEIWEGVE